MLGLVLGAGVSSLRRNGTPWWSSPGLLLDGSGPAILLDVPRNGCRSSTGTLPFSDVLTVSSGSKRVIGPTGTLDTIAANQLAMDWSSGRRRLLIETGSATKYGPYGEAIAANWTKTGATQGATVAGADGTLGLTSFVEDTTTGTHGVTNFVANFPSAAAAGECYALQVDVKKGVGGRLFLISFGTGAWVSSQSVVVDPGTGAVSSQTAGISRASVTARTGGIWHVEVTVVTDQAGTMSPSFHLRDGATASYTGDGASSVYLGYLNLEKVASPLSPPSSYVPIASTAAVTRIADDVRLSTPAFEVFKSSTLSMALRGSMITPGAGTARIFFEASNSGSNERVRIYKGTIAQDISVTMATAGSALQVMPVLADGDGDFGLAFSFLASLYRASLDGASATETVITAPNRSAMLRATVGNVAYPCRFFIDEIVMWPIAGSAVGLAAQAHVWS